MNLNVNSLTLEDSKDDEKTKLLKGFQVFLYDQIDDIDHSSEDHFKKFLEKMVPKTRTVINAMKKYIPNGVSYLIFYTIYNHSLFIVMILPLNNMRNKIR